MRKIESSKLLSAAWRVRSRTGVLEQGKENENNEEMYEMHAGKSRRAKEGYRRDGRREK